MRLRDVHSYDSFSTGSNGIWCSFGPSARMQTKLHRRSARCVRRGMFELSAGACRGVRLALTLPSGPPKLMPGRFSGRPALYQNTSGFRISCTRMPAATAQHFALTRLFRSRAVLRTHAAGEVLERPSRAGAAREGRLPHLRRRAWPSARARARSGGTCKPGLSRERSGPRISLHTE